MNGQKPQTFQELGERLSRLKESRHLGKIRTMQSAPNSWCIVDDLRVLNLASNNYLGLAEHPTLKQNVFDTLQSFGVGSGASRTSSGTTSLHLELERKLASFKCVESLLLFASGVLANMAVIPALVDRQDAIIVDELSHPSIMSGSCLSGARVAPYRHNDMDSLKEVLEATQPARRKLLVTEGVFSLGGDLARLPEIVYLADKFGAMLMIDDSHGDGVMGPGGRGTVHHFGLQGRIELEVGSLGKAFGVVGGFVAGATELTDILRYTASAFSGTTSPTPMDVAASLAAVDIVEQGEGLRARLRENASYFAACIRSSGFDTGCTETAIIPVMFDSAGLAQDFEQRLFSERVLTRAYCASGRPRLRVQVSATHSRSDLDFGVSAFRRVSKELGCARTRTG
jgi:glycine C-acetyltransferase